MTKNQYHCLVTVPLPFNQPFTYLSEQKLEPGTIVEVPFGKRNLAAVIEDCQKITDSQNIENTLQNKKTFNIKSISKTLNHIPPLSPKLIKFINWVAKYTLYPKGLVLKMVMPLKIEELHKINQTGTLLSKNILHEKTKTIIQLQKYQSFNLNREQQPIAEKIIKNKNQYKVSVIHGVTGSGKTEVFLKIIENIIQNGGQALILLPEIVLTTHLLERFRTRLASNIVIENWHSNVTPAQKRKIWSSVAQGHIDLLVGARSALFLPFKNLKLIVIDEEHDTSFKQEEGGVIYHARDMSIVRANIANIPVILSSATPSLEAFYGIQYKNFDYYKLVTRYSGVMLPEIKIIDMHHPKLSSNLNKNSSNKNKTITHIHPKTKEEILKNLHHKKQSLIFINRRGYAPILFCKRCDKKLECINCNIAMAYHKKESLIRCHYCNYTIPYSKECTSCKTKDCLIHYGVGVERIKEDLQSFLPNETKILIITSDTINTSKKGQEAIHKIQNGEVDIIIGTQIISKGMHFPYLQFVSVIDSDPSALGADLRSLERTYQMLCQVIGRAGREKERGKVFLQTHEPQSELLQHVINNSTQDFIHMELAHRKDAFMPPYARVIMLTFSSQNEQKLLSYINSLKKTLPQSNEEVLFWGPATAPIYLLQKHYRYRIIAKSKKNFPLQKEINQLLQNNPNPSNIKVKIDVDPYNFN